MLLLARCSAAQRSPALPCSVAHDMRAAAGQPATPCAHLTSGHAWNSASLRRIMQGFTPCLRRAAATIPRAAARASRRELKRGKNFGDLGTHSVPARRGGVVLFRCGQAAAAGRGSGGGGGAAAVLAAALAGAAAASVGERRAAGGSCEHLLQQRALGFGPPKLRKEGSSPSWGGRHLPLQRSPPPPHHHPPTPTHPHTHTPPPPPPPPPRARACVDAVCTLPHRAQAVQHWPPGEPGFRVGVRVRVCQRHAASLQRDGWVARRGGTPGGCTVRMVAAKTRQQRRQIVRGSHTPTVQLMCCAAPPAARPACPPAPPRLPTRLLQRDAVVAAPVRLHLAQVQQRAQRARRHQRLAHQLL